MGRKTPSAQSPQWRLMNSQVLAGLGKTDNAIHELQLLIQEFPELPEPYNNLGVLLAAQGHYESAAEALLSAIQARPNYKVALQNLGDLYLVMAQQAHAKAKLLADDKSLLPLPKPAASVTTTTNIRTLR
jgi:Flp pilus assembly protein TadD